MEKFKIILNWLVDKPLFTKICIAISAVFIVLALLFSCSTWKGASVGGTHVVNKEVKDSVSYSTSWTK